jgi:hypothetical protein
LSFFEAPHPGWRVICTIKIAKWRVFMRSAIVGLIVATLATVGCNRTDGSVAAAGNPAGTGGPAEGAASTAAARDSRPATHEVTIPAGTTLPIVLETPVASGTSHLEERVNAHLARPVVLHGETVLPVGSRVTGVVTDATRAGKVKGRAHVAVRFDTLSPAGRDERYPIHTSSVGRTAEATKRKDALEIGAPAAGGALIGALVGGKKGALVGGAVGGGAGTAVVLSTRGKDVRLPKGASITLRLTEPVTVKVRG